MKNSYFILLSLFLFSSCTNNEKKILSIEKKKMYLPSVEVLADRKLALEVDGMSCEHACGGAIRMALKETNAVDRVSFDFVTERKTNKAIISFDKSKITVDEIIAIVQKVNKGQFTTGKSVTETIEAKNVERANSSTENAENTKTIETSFSDETIEMPNILSFIRRIF